LTSRAGAVTTDLFPGSSGEFCKGDCDATLNQRVRLLAASSKRTLSIRRSRSIRHRSCGPFNNGTGRAIMEDHSIRSDEAPQAIADDIIHGADAIAEHIYGHRRHRRKVYYLAECSRLPIFRLGSTLCLRKSEFRRWIACQEARVTSGKTSSIIQRRLSSRLDAAD
jgi:hypothetical protein